MDISLKQSIIHFTGLNYFWFSSEKIISKYVENALVLAEKIRLNKLLFLISNVQANSYAYNIRPGSGATKIPNLTTYNVLNIGGDNCSSALVQAMNYCERYK